MINIKELPHVFRGSVDHKINNKSISYIKENTIIRLDTADIIDKINKLFKSTRYIFNIGVIIKTKNKVYDTKIMSRNSNSLLTVDDEVIPIKDIYDLIIKDRY